MDWFDSIRFDLIIWFDCLESWLIWFHWFDCLESWLIWFHWFDCLDWFDWFDSIDSIDLIDLIRLIWFVFDLVYWLIWFVFDLVYWLIDWLIDWLIGWWITKRDDGDLWRWWWCWWWCSGRRFVELQELGVCHKQSTNVLMMVSPWLEVWWILYLQHYSCWPDWWVYKDTKHATDTTQTQAQNETDAWANETKLWRLHQYPVRFQRDGSDEDSPWFSD